MKVFIAVHHPAHVHFFKNTIQEFRDSGHDVRVVARDKDIVVNLLQHYHIPHEILVQSYSNMRGLVKRQLEYEYKVVKEAARFGPDVMASVGSPAIGHAAKILRVPHIMFTDNDVLSNRLAIPFADLVCTPDNFRADYGGKHVRYPGYQELAYLHPEEFEPDADLLRQYGVEPRDDFFILRFVSWEAHHDVGKEGFTKRGKEQLVSLLDDHGEVYITSEGELHGGFEEYRLPIPVHVIHHLLYHANLYVGDSQTMATEAALLGTPAIRSNSFVGEDDMENFLELEEKYDLLYSIRDESEAITKIEELISSENLQQAWELKKERLLEEKGNVREMVSRILLEYGRSEREEERRPNVHTSSP